MLWHKAQGAGGVGAGGIVTDGLVLHLDAANPSSYPGSGGTWSDVSPEGNNATIVGATFDSGNDTFSLDGNDYFVAPDLNPVAFTACAWVRLDILGDFQGIMGQASDIWNNLSFAFRFLTDNKLNLALSNNGNALNASVYGEISSVATFTTNVWYFVCASYSNPTRKMYIDGSPAAYTSVYGVNPFTLSLYSSTANTAIGAYAFGVGLSYTLHGDIGEVHFYDRALTDAEVLANYAVTKSRYGH